MQTSKLIGPTGAYLGPFQIFESNILQSWRLHIFATETPPLTTEKKFIIFNIRISSLMVYITFAFFAWAPHYYILSSALDGQNYVPNQLNSMVDIAEKKDHMVNLVAKLAVLFFMKEIKEKTSFNV